MGDEHFDLGSIENKDDARRAEQPVEEASRPPGMGRIPIATYRVQLQSDVGLGVVQDLLPYLRDLGVSDLYLSPLFQSREESSHGYDVVDHGTIDPAFGSLADFQTLALSAQEEGMGILLDVVPNHMGINDPANTWWLDVLEHGEAAQHAAFFDIDWHPAASHLRHKVLLPFLGAPFGEVLESGQLRVVFQDKRLQLAYADKRFPLARSTWPEEFAGLAQNTPMDEAARDSALGALNGHEGDARSFDRLEALLDAQSYRLAYWRVAADEINYRRFFDINDLAAIRVEDPRVFEAVHILVARFLAENWVTGLRIDHPDGLLDPEGYFQQLQSLYRQARGEAWHGEQVYVVAEKILAGDESLPENWAVSGTTGYDFLNVVSRLLVAPAGLATLRANYERLTDVDETAADTAYQSKREVLVNSLASELNVLAGQLDRIAQQHRASRDFTRRTLERGLREVIACLPVYRTYVRPRGWDVAEADYRHVTTAVRWAKRRNPGAPHAAFDFIASVLRLENPPTLSPEQADERRRFALKVQQVTGPAMAKGLEDTAFYRYYPLASLNEVGGELDAKPLEPEEFHRLMAHRIADWPHSMSASGTHDTKRGEDFRARLHVLSEVADEWVETVERWHDMSRPLLAEVEGEATPDRNERYLLYQTIVGTWPAAPMNSTEQFRYAERITAYMQKALREAKRHTSWMNPSPVYESTVTAFVRELISGPRGAELRAEIDRFAHRISTAGYINGLTQLLLKITLPGVPDCYQGTEFWDFNLVDPDNRRPVDFAWRRRTLQEVQRRFSESPARLAADLASRLSDDRTKQFITWRALATRGQHADAFARGDYVPLTLAGLQRDRAFGMARRLGDKWIVVIVPRQVHALLDDQDPIDWQDTTIDLPKGVSAWQSEWTGDPAATTGRLADLLTPLPVALLTSRESP